MIKINIGDLVKSDRGLSWRVTKVHDDGSWNWRVETGPNIGGTGELACNSCLSAYTIERAKKIAPRTVMVKVVKDCWFGSKNLIGTEQELVGVGEQYTEIDLGLPPSQQSWLNDRFEVISTKTKTKTTRNRPLKKGERKPLFLVASRDGMTHKGLANMVNKRKVDTLGNSVTHALSKYEDKYGKKIDLKEAVVFRLVPYTVRTDKKNGRARIGSEIK